MVGIPRACIEGWMAVDPPYILSGCLANTNNSTKSRDRGIARRRCFPARSIAADVRKLVHVEQRQFCMQSTCQMNRHFCYMPTNFLLYQWLQTCKHKRITPKKKGTLDVGSEICCLWSLRRSHTGHISLWNSTSTYLTDKCCHRHCIRWRNDKDLERCVWAVPHNFGSPHDGQFIRAPYLSSRTNVIVTPKQKMHKKKHSAVSCKVRVLFFFLHKHMF